MSDTFSGHHYTLCQNWRNTVPIEEFIKPINYLEIGVFYGINFIHVARTYGRHPDSKLYAIDPWEDYQDYPEYKGEQSKIHQGFMRNIEIYKSLDGVKDDKVNIRRGYSHVEVPKLEDEFFDLIYIDGNHEPEYVLEDAVNAFRKLKVGGYMIFDDYGWGGENMTQRGIDAFMNGYHKRIEKIGLQQSQMTIKRIK